MMYHGDVYHGDGEIDTLFQFPFVYHGDGEIDTLFQFPFVE